MSIERVVACLHQHRDRHLQQLRELCRIPSISAQPQHAADVRRAVEWTCRHCRALGLEAEVHETAGHPLVFAQYVADPAAPTYLVYGHLDVQPTSDRALWDADPFEPVVDGEWLVCRGAADDKGQVMVYLRAIEAWLEAAGTLPVNIKLLIEGEEEVGSVNLAPFLREHRELLACEAVLISDTGILADGVPTITYGTRGLCYMEVRLHGPAHDLHSGTHGGPVTNPANALARIIASLHDEHGRVNIDGFYDDVLEISQRERELSAAFPLDEQQYARDLGVPGFNGEQGYSVQELRSARPTLDVNGIYGGYTKEGASTIIPAMAGAKISMRLVPRQRGDDIAAKFKRAVEERCPRTVQCEIIEHAHAAAYMTPLDAPFIEPAREALRAAFGSEVAFIREGGSLPILPTFRDELGAECLLIGLASPSCNAHGPNERVRLPDLDRGAEAVARFFELVAK